MIFKGSIQKGNILIDPRGRDTDIQLPIEITHEIREALVDGGLGCDVYTVCVRLLDLLPYGGCCSLGSTGARRGDELVALRLNAVPLLDLMECSHGLDHVEYRYVGTGFGESLCEC